MMMREPNTKVTFDKKDFTFSDQVTAEATSVQILGFDFSHCKRGTAGVQNDGRSGFSMHVMGYMMCSPAASYAIYNMMKANAGYDVVFYPQFETTTVRPLGLGCLYKKTTVKTTARLGKLNK